MRFPQEHNVADKNDKPGSPDEQMPPGPEERKEPAPVEEETTDVLPTLTWSKKIPVVGIGASAGG